MSSLNYNWRKIRNFRNSSLRRQEIFEIRFYLSSLNCSSRKEKNFRNSVLSRRCTGEKEEIFEIWFYVVKNFSKLGFMSSLCWRKGKNFRNLILRRQEIFKIRFYLSSLNCSSRKGRNFRNSILHRQEIFEIRFYLIIELEKRKKFSKFEFISSLSYS